MWSRKAQDKLNADIGKAIEEFETDTGNDVLKVDIERGSLTDPLKRTPTHKTELVLVRTIIIV